MFDKEWTNRLGMNHQPTCAVHRWFHKTESWFVKLPLRCYPFSQKNTFPNPAVFDFFDLIFYINSYIYLSFIFLKRIYSQIHMIHFSFFNTKPSKTQNPIFIYKVHKCQLLLCKPSSRSVTYLLAHAY